jgi:hypothetical protein
MLIQRAANGGSIVVPLLDISAQDMLRALLNSSEAQLSEGKLSNYAMLAEVDFQNPLFSRFNDARFRDFTKIRFWKLRNLQLPDSGDWQVLARFDSGTPAYVERRTGQGTIAVLASSWSPADSQLALSTKFVPIVAGWLAAADPDPDTPRRAWVGQSVPLPEAYRAAETVVIRPGGVRQTFPPQTEEMDGFDEPGIYYLEQGEKREAVAVNVASAESLTAPLDPTALEQFGVRLGRQPSRHEEMERQRQLRDQELERRQHIWQWLIAAALVLLVAETWLAARATKAVAAPAPGV